jgi:flagellar hook-basal body complex protein FliE
LHKNITPKVRESRSFPFKDIFDEAINNVHQTEAQAQIDAARAVAGDMDDLHTLTIDIAKADLALSMLVALRNKALEAYNEIMRISM